MTESVKRKEKPRTIWLKPDQVKVPDVRVRASWDNEMLAMFKASIAAEGIQQTILVVQDQEDYWLVDGAHRLEEAQLQNIPKVLCVIWPGTMKDAHMKNLMLNRLHGKTKASEMAMVVGELTQKFKATMEEIEEKTGLKRDYIEKMMVVSRVHPEVMAALDSERISVGMAYEIGRVPDPEVQERLLIQVKTYEKLTVKDMHDIVDETLRIMNSPKAKDQPTLFAVPSPITIKCHFCEQDRLPKEMRGFNICQGCFAISYDAVRRQLAAQAAQTPSAQIPPQPSNAQAEEKGSPP
jgi:ParB family chromosome partitioning protein